MSRTSVSLPGVIETPSAATWDDLVLPEKVIESLREFASWVTHRDKVELEWRGKITGGPVALFSGTSGTGKTMAANVLARALGLDLYKVDLALLISKYIGETEKNLNSNLPDGFLVFGIINGDIQEIIDKLQILFGAHRLSAIITENQFLSIQDSTA